MESKTQVKTMLEYRKELELLVSKDILKQFDQYLIDGKKISAIRLLKKNGVISS
ncbi:MAG: hypothetical protein KAT04_08195 [Methylococcales bacterium]|nr:hypothetical protein [Methylococcales bacterium]